MSLRRRLTLGLAWTIACVISGVVILSSFSQAPNYTAPLIFSAVIGISQWLVLRAFIGWHVWWVLATALGVVVGLEITVFAFVFVVGALGSLASGDAGAAAGYVVIGGTMGMSVGFAQCWVIPAHARVRVLWVVASALGGVAGLAATTVGGPAPAPPEKLALAGAAGGLAYAVITGAVLVWQGRNSP